LGKILALDFLDFGVLVAGAEEFAAVCPGVGEGWRDYGRSVKHW